MLTRKRPKKRTDLLLDIRQCIALGHYRETIHAKIRKKERIISLPEIVHVLTNSWHEKNKDRFDELYVEWNYSIRGKTKDGDEMRIIVSFDEKTQLLVITAFYL